MWITFLLLFLFIVLPRHLAASHLFIHSQSLFQTWAQAWSHCLLFQGWWHVCSFMVSILFSWAPLTVLNTLLGTGIWLMFSLLEVRTVCGGGHVNSGVCTCVHMCVPICDVCFSSVTPPVSCQLFHSLRSLSLNKFIPILWNISSLNPQECSDSICSRN